MCSKHPNYSYTAPNLGLHGSQCVLRCIYSVSAFFSCCICSVSVFFSVFQLLYLQRLCVLQCFSAAAYAICGPWKQWILDLRCLGGFFNRCFSLRCL